MIPKRIVFAGSSSVHGRGDTALGGFVHRFRLWHESRDPRNFVYELGIFGESTQSLTSRLGAEASVRRPHLIALYPGFNDIRRDGGEQCKTASSPDEFRIAMKSLISAPESTIPVLMMTGFPFDESRTAPYQGTESFYLRRDAEVYTEVIRSVCKEYDVPILDYFSLWSSVELEGFLAEDGLHANPAGHQLLFEQLRDHVVDAYS